MVNTRSQLQHTPRFAGQAKATAYGRGRLLPTSPSLPLRSQIRSAYCTPRTCRHGSSSTLCEILHSGELCASVLADECWPFAAEEPSDRSIFSGSPIPSNERTAQSALSPQLQACSPSPVCSHPSRACWSFLDVISRSPRVHSTTNRANSSASVLTMKWHESHAEFASVGESPKRASR